MITIGKMSLACHVSIKTLRHYDKIGLFRPALIDEETGYRYYALDQVSEMIRISRYKRFGLSLSAIQELLQAEPAEQKRMLVAQKRKLQEQLGQLQMTMQDLDVVLERIQPDKPAGRKEYQMNEYTIEILETPKQDVIARRQMMGVGDFGTVFGQLFEELKDKGVLKPGMTGARYYDSDFDQSSSDIEVFVTTDSPEAANASIGGTLVAKTTHKGGYSDLNEAYAALVLWIEQNGYETIGAPYELYTKTGFDHLAPSEWETEIYFPIRKK